VDFLSFFQEYGELRKTAHHVADLAEIAQ
jgi:hypothetical protein